MWVPEVHYEPPFSLVHRLLQPPSIETMRLPHRAIWPIAQKVYSASLMGWESSVWMWPSLSLSDPRYCVTEYNASGRKWICSFKWCMGSFWTPFCGQEWSSLNYCKWNQLLLRCLFSASLYTFYQVTHSSVGAEILLLQQLLQFHNHQVQVEDTCQPSVHLSVTAMPTNLPSLS